jgi:hypothetical protein
MNPWLDPNSYEPEPGFDTWWERNRVRAVVFAAIACSRHGLRRAREHQAAGEQHHPDRNQSPSAKEPRP